MALSKIEIPGADPLYFTGSPEPPQISGQSLSKLLGSNIGHGLDNPRSGGTPESSPGEIVSANNAPLKRAHAATDVESLGPGHTMVSTTIMSKHDLGLASKEDTAGAHSESDPDEEEVGASATNKKVSDRRRAQNAKFKSWYLGSIPNAVIC